MVLTFLGTKGGTGTTTLAINCAADLHRLSLRPTVVVDLKPGTGDVGLFLNLLAVRPCRPHRVDGPGHDSGPAAAPRLRRPRRRRGRGVRCTVAR
jgi:hypothetical protein